MYYAAMENQSPINANGDKDDRSDSGYCPGDESDEPDAPGEDNGELRDGVDANELAQLYSDSSLSLESPRQMYEQRQAYSVWLTTRTMIMAIANTCVSYLPSNVSDYFLSFIFLSAALALYLTHFLMTMTLFRYKHGYCSTYEAQKCN
ncbi:hypothetical protein RMCBS344292_01633 [Rhizopus microsporus]|nr:hypothetical protein RMCBS344292_01633 [Rhizopus microsporus]